MVVTTTIVSAYDSFIVPDTPPWLVERAYALYVPRPVRNPPRTFSPAWPDVPCADPIAEVARQLALRLVAALDGNSLRSLKITAGIEHSTVSAIVNGMTWPDLATIARLERGLHADLWPGRVDD